MTSLSSQIESILFVASSPLRSADIAKAVGASTAEVERIIEELKAQYNSIASGIHIFFVDGAVRMGTNPDNAGAIERFIKEEAAGELTKAQLETLTVIAYRGPITRPELEQIRGVNCAIILRNLQIRGLVEERNDDEKLAPVFVLSFEALRHLGVNSVDELPEYAALSIHAHIEGVLSDEGDDAHA